MRQEGVCVDELISSDEQLRIEVVKRSDGIYSLRRFETYFDEEERVHYEVRCSPDPDGLFADAGLAVAEAKRLICL